MGAGVRKRLPRNRLAPLARRRHRAITYVAAAGWDGSGGGGIWWNTEHPYKAGEAIASDTLLATLLYVYTGSSFDLGQARKFLGVGQHERVQPARRAVRRQQHRLDADRLHRGAR